MLRVTACLWPKPGNYERDDWKEIIPQTDAVLQGASCGAARLFAQYEQNASSQLRIFDLNGDQCQRPHAAVDWNGLRIGREMESR